MQNLTRYSFFSINVGALLLQRSSILPRPRMYHRRKMLRFNQKKRERLVLWLVLTSVFVEVQYWFIIWCAFWYLYKGKWQCSVWTLKIPLPLNFRRIAALARSFVFIFTKYLRSTLLLRKKQCFMAYDVIRIGAVVCKFSPFSKFGLSS